MKTLVVRESVFVERDAELELGGLNEDRSYLIKDCQVMRDLS